MTIFKLPDLGEGLPDAEIREWHVKVGDSVKTDEPLVSMETAKAVVEVPAPFDGIVSKLCGEEGQVIQTGATLVEFNTTNSSEETRVDSGTVAGNIEVGNELVEETAVVMSKRQQDPSGKQRIMPAVRALAKRLSVDLDKVTGSGRAGLITLSDVRQAAADSSASAGGQSGYQLDNPEQLKGSRRMMAQTMSRSHAEVVPATVFDQANIQHWPEGTDITYRVIAALVAACQAEPALNALYDGQSCSRKLEETVQLGLAMDSAEGLFVPVIKDTASLVAQPQALRAEIDTIKLQVKERSIAQERLSGASITLSNFGVFAGQYATPVVVPPQVAILATGKIREQVLAIKGEASCCRTLPLSLTFDHRAVTGGEATRFMKVLIESLEA